MQELRDRGEGRRESGGFLLGQNVNGTRYVKSFLPYDVIDPNCLQGMIYFDGSKMDRVWDLCRQLNLEVVADVHTHPRGFGQSSIDQANPMIPERGHIALIVPNFADRYYPPGKIGIYEFRGTGSWLDRSRQGKKFFHVGILA